jgi:hypothetical protein
MLSGTAEPECRDHPPEVMPAVGASVSGTDIRTRPAASPESANDPPQPDATTITVPATIHPSGNGKASSGRFAWPAAVI